MTRDEILSEVREHFGDIPRPRMFIRGTCRCEECLEHERVMQSFSPDSLPLGELDNPGWDPICFASDEAYAYLMPGLVRLALEHTDDYIQQFLFHIDDDEHVAALSLAQSLTLVQVLDYLVAHETSALDNNLAADDLNRARKRLERWVRRARKHDRSQPEYVEAERIGGVRR